MNFLNRRMFAGAGTVNQYYYVNNNNKQVPLDKDKLFQVLTTVRIPELEALISNPDVTYSPETKELFRQIVGTRKAQVSRVSPSLMEFGTNVPSISPGSALENIGGQLKDASLELIERGANLGQMFMADSKGPQDIFQSERYPFDNPRNVPGTMMSAPGFLPNEAASLRRGYTDEQLSAILNRAQSGEIQDFQSEVDNIDEQVIDPKLPELPTTVEVSDIRFDGTQVPKQKGPDLARIAEENNMTIEQVERIVAEQESLSEDSFDKPIFSSVDEFGDSLSSGETLSFVGGAPEMEAKRLAYEKSLIGVDEAGFPIEKPGAIDKKPERSTSISDFTEELAALKPVNVLKTEEDSKMEIEEKFLPTLPDIDLSITQAEADKINKEESSDDAVTRKLKEPGFFGSDNFLNFIRNVGGELTRTGDMAQGLSSGAAKAAEERAGRELLADQEERKYKREIELAVAKAEATSGSDLIMKPKDIRDLNTDLKTNMSDLEGGVAATGFVDLAIETLKEAIENGESVGGFFGAMKGFQDNVLAFVGKERSFEDQSAQTKINKLVEVVRQKNLQAILGESGRTISDKDRAIILKVFGDLNMTEDASITLGKLVASRQSLAQNNIKLKGLIEDDTAFMFTQGALGQGFGGKLLPDYQRVLQIDPLASQAAAILAQFMGGTAYGGNIQEVDL